MYCRMVGDQLICRVFVSATGSSILNSVSSAFDSSGGITISNKRSSNSDNMVVC